MAEALEQKVYQVVSDVFGVPLAQVNDDLTSDQVPTWDSFNMINLLMVLESELGVSISPEDAKDMMSVRLIVEVLRERGAG